MIHDGKKQIRNMYSKRLDIEINYVQDSVFKSATQPRRVRIVTKTPKETESHETARIKFGIW